MNYDITYDNNEHLPNIKIKNFLMITSKPLYQPVPQRSFTLRANYNNLDALADMVTHGHKDFRGKISDVEIAKTTPDIIGLNPAISGHAYIPNGWGTERFRFLLEVEYMVNGDALILCYLQGYSEYTDLSLNGLVDPNMRFYINSIMEFIKSYDPVYGVYTTRPYRSYKLITDKYGGTKYEEIDAGQLYTVRPGDVFNNLYISDTYGGQEIVFDNNLMRQNEVKTSDVVYNNPLKYFSTTINNYTDACLTAEMSSNSADILYNADRAISNPNLLTNTFLLAIQKLTGNIHPDYFTINMLTSMFPNLENVTNLITKSADPIINYNTILDSENTVGVSQPTAVNLKVQTLANMLPSIIMDIGLTRASFSYTNSPGHDVFIANDVNSFIEGIDVGIIVPKLEAVFNHTVAPLLTNNNLIRVELFVNIDVLGDTDIAILYDNDPMVNYRFPTFADSLYNPMVTDIGQKQLICEDFSMMFDSILGYGHNIQDTPLPDPKQNYNILI